MKIQAKANRIFYHKGTFASKEKMSKTFGNTPLILGLLIVLLLFTGLFSMTIGRYEISYHQLYLLFREYFTGETLLEDGFIRSVVFQVRLPRIIAAIFIGGALSISGAVFQAMFRNPMVSSDILGVTSGAGFGASIGLLIGLSYWKVELLAFGFGIIAVSLTYFLSHAVGRESNNIVLMILSGIIVGTLFKSFISCAKYLADPNDALQAITFWLMGSMAMMKSKDLIILILPIIIGSIPLLCIGWKLNAMAFGEEEAMALGIQTEKLKLIVIVCSTVITSTSVAMCGIIGWVGLIIPHLVRMVVGPDNHILIPASMLTGAIYLLAIDNLSRTLTAVEIPISILTSIIGTPFFIYLLFKTRRTW